MTVNVTVSVTYHKTIDIELPENYTELDLKVVAEKTVGLPIGDNWLEDEFEVIVNEDQTLQV